MATDAWRRRLAALAEAKRDAGYWQEVAEVAESTDYLFSIAELDSFASNWEHHCERLDLGVPPALGLTLGRAGRGRRMNDRAIGLVARALELRLAGMTPTAADDASISAWAAPSTPGVYRKRIRDRLSS